MREFTIVTRAARVAAAPLGLILVALLGAACGGEDALAGGGLTGADDSVGADAPAGRDDSAVGDDSVANDPVIQDDGAPVETAPTGNVPGEPCLLTPDEVAALTGETVAGRAATSPFGPGETAGCTWGDLLMGVEVSLLFEVPEIGLSTITETAGLADTTTPVTIGEEGELVDIYVRGGGGGKGWTVVTRLGDMYVALGASGDDADPVALQEVAAAVVERL